MKLTPELEAYKSFNKDTAKVFSRRFTVLRNAYQMSLNDVADTLGISRQSIVYYAMGNRLPRIPILISIAKLFNTSTDYLLGFNNSNRLYLPCKVGETVYMIENVKSGRRREQQIVSGQIDRFIIGGLGVPLADICTEDKCYYACGYPQDYFLTLEEAQEALKRTEERK
ncbi:MAG: helix-turn-helix domain-containing protein [Ruminococcus sp.]|nr:helix-turn-helix domain-containing protein [Ruminococcus sp.]MCM1380843.1 helix-turn-helix domain-containing protein [Muribaculaceae bacterium]MCM1478971.1 helix-turn-helix domain-containing protein [Muribaculaceae bacterium]